MSGMPRRVAQRIMARCAARKKGVVIPDRQGVPARAFDFNAYRDAAERAKKVKPWTRRLKK